MKGANPKLGTVACPAGGVADVYQTRKRGRHFYTRCDCCGLLQGTGQKRQQLIWDGAEFEQGQAVVKPANVEDGGQGEPEPTVAPESPEQQEPATAAAGDFDPGEVTEPESEPEPEPGKGIRKGLAAAGVTLLAVGAGLWMS